MTQRCNCGGEMESGKLFSCRQCGATLIVDTKGIQKWFSADGKQGTYCPKSEKEDKSNVLF